MTDAVEFFAARLAFQTDVSDVQAALAARGEGERGAEPALAARGEGEREREGGAEPALAAGGAASPGANAAARARFVLVDTRSRTAWDQGHIPGAVHLPTAELATAELDPDIPLVTYCWGPGCNGATRAALVLARRGFQVREMIGGIEYWIREGFPVRTKEGDVGQHPDPLTAPSCGC